MSPFSQASFHLIDLLDELLHNAQDGVADQLSLLLELLEIDVVDMTALDDLIGSLLWDDTQLSLGLSKSGLKVQIILRSGLV